MLRESGALKHLKPEVLSSKPQPQILRVEAIYDGIENGRRPSLRLEGRKEVKAAIRAAKDQGLSGQQALEKVGEFYPEADIQASIQRHRREKLKSRLTIAAACVAITGALAHNDGSTRVEQQAAVIPENADAPAFAAPSSTEISVDNTTVTTASTTTVQPPAPTTTQVSVTSSPPVQPGVQLASAPVVKPFEQRHFGPVQSIVVDEAFSLEVKQIAQNTRDINAEDRSRLYEYVDTLAAFNGVDKDNIQAGERISYHDCPSNGDVILAGDSVASFAERNGLSAAEANQLNNGGLQVVAGWCGRTRI